jgi:general secretion pathway protein G
MDSSRAPSGFTLLELMVVLVILALLATIAAPQVMKYLRKAKHDTAVVQVQALAGAIDYFHYDVGRYPTSEEGLKALVDRPAGLATWDGPYLDKKASLIDPWGAAYLYKNPGDHRVFDVSTLGADAKPGGDREATDVGNW